MENTTKRNVTLICMAVLAAFIIVLFSFAFLGVQDVAFAESIEVTAMTSSEGNMDTVNVDNITYYMIKTGGNLKYALRDTSENKSYLLMNDFVISDRNWCTENGSTRTVANTIAGFYYNQANGQANYEKRHRITFSPYSGSETISDSDVVNCGLFAIFNGTLKYLELYYEGRIQVNASSAVSTVSGANTVYVGAIAGVFNGTISNCTISVAGSVFAFSQSSNLIIYGGGIAGEFAGTILDSVVSISGSISVSNKNISDESSSDLTCIKNTLYAGGIGALAKRRNDSINNQIKNSTINVSGSVSTNDVTKISIGEAVYPRDDPNPDGCVFPAGGLFATVAQAMVTDNEITISGTISSNGSTRASRLGSIAGGLFGELRNNFILSCNYNVITLSGKLMTSNLAYTINKIIFGISVGKNECGEVYQGGLIGKINGSVGDGSISDLAIVRESDFVTRTDPNECPGGEYYGLLCGYVGTGSTKFGDLNKGNVWFVGYVPSNERMASAVSEDKPVEAVSYGSVKRLRVFGGGSIKAVFSSRKLSFYALQQYSPFFNWYNTSSNMMSNTPYTNSAEIGKATFFDATINQTYEVKRFTPGVNTAVNEMCALFLTTEINDAGNMAQFVAEMNYEDENEPIKLNQSWVSVKLNADITFEKGMAVVKEFKGTFDGQGHTISFAVGTTIDGTEKTEENENRIAMFGILDTGAQFINTNIRFAGTIYAGVQEDDQDAMVNTVYTGIVAAVNHGTIKNVSCTLQQAGLITAFGKSVYGGGLVGYNDGGTIVQIDMTIDGKITANGNKVYLGGLVGSSNTGSSYNMINVYAKGEIISSLAEKATSKDACLGGFAGIVSAKLDLKNVVVNVREYSNYNNDVLLTSCKHNEATYNDMLEDAAELENDLRTKTVGQTKGGYQDFLEDYFNYNDSGTYLGVAARSQADYDKCKNELIAIYERLTAEADDTASEDYADEFLSVCNSYFNQFDCSAVCSDCVSSSKKFAIAGSIAANNYGFNNAWVLGSYTQYPDETGEAGVGTRKLYFTSDLSTTTAAKAKNLNMIYVRNGSCYCVMDISEINANNILFTVSIDTSKVFTGWYTTFNHTVMAPSDYISADGFRPGLKTGEVYFSSVINSLITDYSVFDELANTTNAGQTYEGDTFVLGADLVFPSAHSYVPIGKMDGSTVRPFKGTLDGKGYSITISGSILSSDYSGLFGYLGEGATIKCLTVIYDGNKTLKEHCVFGGVAAVSYGFVGQDSTSNKVGVIYKNMISNATTAGGVVGCNYGTVRNVEVSFAETASGRGVISTKSINDDGVRYYAVCGGVVAINYEGATVKNTYVVNEVKDTDEFAQNLYAKSSTKTDHGYAGGLVGYNLGNVYSGVVEQFFITDEQMIAKVSGVGNAGTLVGHNDPIGVVDALWALYSLLDFALPYEDGDFYDNLIGGETEKGNRLIKYGHGSIKTSVYSNNAAQTRGGSIVFRAEPDEGVPFYNYTASLTSGEVVSSAEGGSGQNLTPIVANGNKESLEGKTFYAIFVRSEITNENDYYGLVKSVNSGFSAYVNYIFNFKGTVALNLYADNENFDSIGANGRKFVGSLNGNGYSIYYRSSSLDENVKEGKALFGVIAEKSVVQNLTVNITRGLYTATAYDDELSASTTYGLFAAINMGTITEVEVNLTGNVNPEMDESYEELDYAGIFVGINHGVISSTTVNLLSESFQGNNYAASVKARYAGALVGLNRGTIGSDRLDSVKVVVNTVTTPVSVYGTSAVGGVVGVNRGVITNVNLTMNGRLGAAKNCDGKVYVGGVAGINESDKANIGILTLNFNASAELASEVAMSVDNLYFFGGVAGLNDSSSMIGEEGVKGLSKIYYNANFPNISTALASFGGAVGENRGFVFSIDVLFDQSVEGYKGLGATNYAGGVVGFNAGNVGNCNVTLSKQNSLTLIKGDHLTTDGLSEIGVGSIVGVNSISVKACTAHVYGVLGVTYTSGTEEGKVQKANVGGLVGFNKQEIRDSYVIVGQSMKNTSSKGRTGLVVGYSSVNQAGSLPNVWAVVSNSDPSPASSNKAGYNVLKIVGNATVSAEFINENEDIKIRFTAANVVGMPIVWYKDISTQDKLFSQATTFTAETGLVDCVYHVCYYDLQINTEEKFSALYQYVNAYNLFNGVMFSLEKSITVRSTLQPIGTKEHPFNGIFEGHNNTITFVKGGIAGNVYSGIFGYVDDNAVIKNFIVEFNEDVIVGSGMSTSAGGLAGRLGGLVQNVALNFISAPYSLKDDAYVGALAGTVSSTLRVENVWTVIYNSAVATIGATDNGGVASNTGLNNLAVLGSGILRVYFKDEESDEFVFEVIENADFYDDWYYDISNHVTVADKANSAIYGTVVAGDRIYFDSVDSLRNVNYTASFIDLIIRNAEDFVKFAKNVNRYGDGGAKFIMRLGKEGYNNITEITVDLNECPPIGTREHPFTGEFDGTMDLSEVYDNSVCYTIRVKGNLGSSENDYTGLFGCVGETGVIRNLIVRADNADDNPEYAGQKFGDKQSVYTGYLAGYFQGTMENVVVVMGDETQLYNINADSVGGMVGMMGVNSSIKNSWLILPENSVYRTVGGYKLANGDIVSYDRATFEVDYPDLKVPNLLYKCGAGKFELHLENGVGGGYETAKGRWKFTLVQLTGGEPAYGFVDNTLLDSGVPTKEFTSSYGDGLVGREYLALFLDNNINEYEDLLKLAALTNGDRRYVGIEFQQSKDIVIQNGYTPIGGQVALTGGSAIGVEYKLIDFIGAYNGNGHKIIIPENVTIDAPYAGLFGILGKTARVRNLYVEVNGKVGVAGGYADSTVYAAPLAALDNGATLENVIVVINKSASISATVDSSRIAVNNAIEFDVFGNVLTPDEDIKRATNVWVLSYNSKYNNAQNAVEQQFYYDQTGRYNGGVNVLTVIAAGEIVVEFTDENYAIRIYNRDNSGNPVKEWYTNAMSGSVEIKVPYDVTGYQFMPSSAVNSLILYASFLNSKITDVADLIDLANDTNDGYDLYGLSFELNNDVVITGSDYVPIGAAMPFNALFDGRGHSITLAEGARIEGEYAGIFGSVGQDAVVKNVKLIINGTLGCDRYTAADLELGKVNTIYAGAIARIQGKLENVIIDGVNAIVDCRSDYAGIAFGYDVQNVMNNVWFIAGADNGYASMGKVLENDKLVEGSEQSTINVMKVIGMGELKATLVNVGDDWFVKLENDYDDQKDYAIKGWYSNYAKDNQISEALGVCAPGTDFRAGNNGTITFTTGLINRRYEVVIINTVITTAEQLLSIVGDVNVGGYTYENTSFSLGADITIEGNEFVSIGTENTRFKGTFSGSYNGVYHTITMAMSYQNEYSQNIDGSLPLFGYNEGVITDLSVFLKTAIDRTNSTVGVIAQYNYGEISNTLVRFNDKAGFTVVGANVGGIAGINYARATIENCIVIIPENVTLKGRFAAGGIVAENYGSVVGSVGGALAGDFYDWKEYRSNALDGEEDLGNVLIYGKIEVENSETSDTVLYVGGAVGISQGQATVTRLSIRVFSSGSVFSDGNSTAVGGVVGRSSASLRHSVIQADGEVYALNTAHSNVGYFVGSIQGSTNNSWMVYSLPRDIKAIGLGFDSVNVLQIKGNGVIDFYIDGDNNIIFEDVTPAGGASIDGWYINNGVAVTDRIGNVDGSTFKPATNISGRTVNVVFINTTISSVEELIIIANTVNSGLYSANLEFRLVNDLTIDVDHVLTACIGTYTEDGAYGFKHKFNGDGHTITVIGVENAESFRAQTYMGIFGYVTASAQVYDLNVVYLGSAFGDERTLAFGGIAGVNAGSITNCKVYVGKAPGDDESAASPAVLKGASVGGIVGENTRLGKISDCDVYLYGTLYAQSIIKDNVAPNAYAGAITGSNNGTVTFVTSYLKTIGDYSVQAVYVGNSTGATYVGGITGSNSGTISDMVVELDVAHLFANSQIIAYAGGLAGSNIGTLENAYIKVGAGSSIRSSNKVENISGGIAGINSYYLLNILIDITNESVVRDSAVGQYRATTSHAENVWVINNDSAINSKIGDINNMTYERINGNPSVSYNDVKGIIESRRAGVQNDYMVEFYADIDKDKGLTMFADAHTSFKTVLNDAPYVYYGVGKLVLVSPLDAKDISVKAVMRREIGDQTELKMLSKALEVGGQEITGTYSLTNDIVVTGNYTAIGHIAISEDDVSRPFGATFDGNYYTVSFKDPVVYGNIYNSVFALNTGLIRKFVVSYDYSLIGDNTAGICIDNKGTIKDSVVYAALDTTISNPIACLNSKNDNDWIIQPVSSNNDYIQGKQVESNRYGAIAVNGNGTLVIDKTAASLTFIPTALDEMSEFAGFSDQLIIYTTDYFIPVSNVNERGYSYSAEFISKYIYTINDLLALVGALDKGYGSFSKNKTYYLCSSDIEISAQAIGGLKSFLGVFEGNDNRLVVSGKPEDTDFVFAPEHTDDRATYQNLSFDLRKLDEEVYLFDSACNASLKNVAIFFDEARDDARLYDAYFGSSLRLENVYVVTSNETTIVEADKYVSENVGAILSTGKNDIEFRTENGKFIATAIPSDEEVFVGWYDTAAAWKFVGKASVECELTAETYKTTFISTEITTADEFTTIAEAVKNGFTFEGASFKVANDITIDFTTAQNVGTDDYFFAGEIDVLDNALTVKGKPLFNVFKGVFKNAVMNSNVENALALVIAAEAKVENVLLTSTAANANIAAQIKGNVFNCWVIADSVASNDKVGYIGKDNTVSVAATLADGVITVKAAFNADAGLIDGIIFFKNAAGEDVYNPAYDTIVSDGSNVATYFVTAKDVLVSEFELKVFALAVEHDYSNNVKLDADIVVAENFSIAGYQGVFYGAGKTITVNTENDFALFTELTGTVRDLKLVVNSDNTITAAISKDPDGIAYLNSSIMAVSENVTPIMQGNLNNVWVVYQAVVDDATFLTDETSDANYLVYNKGSITATVNEEGVVSFVGTDTAEYAFMGYRLKTAKSSSSTYTSSALDAKKIRVMAYSADHFISDLASWNLLGAAIAKTGNKATGKTFTLSADIVVTAEFAAIEGFDGTLDGNSNSLVIDSDAAYNGFVTLGENGLIKNFVVEVFNAEGFGVGVTVFPEAQTENCLTIDYVGVSAGAAKTIAVENMMGYHSAITVNGEGGIFLLDTNDLPEYKLRYWLTDDSQELTYENGKFYLPDEEYDGNVTAIYFSCYTVSITVRGLDDSAVRPNVTPTATYWSDLPDIQSVSVKSTAGYVFWGFVYDDNEAITAINPVRLNIDVTKLTSSIEIFADYSLISTSWHTVTYGELTSAEMSDYLQIDKEQRDRMEAKGYTIVRSCLPEGDTLNVVSDVPRHAGNYKISFKITYTTIPYGESIPMVYTMGETDFGFTIEVRELAFTDLTLADKVYDTTIFASVLSKNLAGFIDDDLDYKTFLDLSDIKFAYYDPKTNDYTRNAGSGYYLTVFSGELQNTGYGNFVHIDYKLPDGIIYQYAENPDGTLTRLAPFEFAINKADLTLEISTITIDYLDQFKYGFDQDGYFEFFDIDDLFKNCYTFSTGISGEVDSETIKNTKLLVIEGDYIVDGVYYYHIKKPGDYHVSTLTDALVNYNPKILGGNARFRVNPSAVSVVLDHSEVEYGDALTAPNYHLHEGTHKCVDANGDGVCDNSVIMREHVFMFFSDVFSIYLSYEQFLKEYLSVDMVVENVKDANGVVVLPIPDGYKYSYGVTYRFLASNKNFVFDEASYRTEEAGLADGEKLALTLVSTPYVDSVKEYVLFCENVLTVVPRNIKVQYTGETSKVFGSADGDYRISAKVIGKKLVSGNSVIVGRNKNEQGESEIVGEYSLYFSVIDAQGNDVSAYYDISYANYSGYVYTITKRTVKVNHTGYNYYFGDLASLKNMSYSTNLSKEAVNTILAIFGKPNGKSLKDIGITITLGYFGDEILKVGKYTDVATVEYSAPEKVKSCLDFVLGNGAFSIIPANLTINVKSFSRDYNKSASLSFPEGTVTYTVSGFMNGDERRLEVRHKTNSYDSNISANAGIYYYRPSGCELVLKDGVSKDEYGYLLQSYTIGAIAYGTYTINALSVDVEVEVGYFDADGTFIKNEDDMLYYGDENAKLRYIVEEYPGYIAELYESEVEGKELTDKEMNDWLIDVFSFTHTPLSYFTADSMVNYGEVTDQGEKSINLHSNDSNITVRAVGAFYVEEVFYKIKDVTIVSDSSLKNPKINCEIVAIRYNYDTRKYEEIENYGLNGKVEELSSGAALKLSNNLELTYTVLTCEDGTCSYRLSARTYAEGVWAIPEDDVLFAQSDGGSVSSVSRDTTFTKPVEIVYTDKEKLVSFVKEHPATIALIVVGIIALVAGAAIIGSVLYRKNRIARKAFHEKAYADILSGENATDAASDESNDENASEEEE